MTRLQIKLKVHKKANRNPKPDIRRLQDPKTNEDLSAHLLSLNREVTENIQPAKKECMMIGNIFKKWTKEGK